MTYLIKRVNLSVEVLYDFLPALASESLIGLDLLQDIVLDVGDV